MKKIKGWIHLIIIIIFIIVFFVSIWLGSTLDGEKIKVIEYTTYTEYLKELDSNATTDTTEKNTYITEGLEHKINATRYIVNATIENKQNKRLINVWIEVKFYDSIDRYVGSESAKIPLLPKGYATNISVDLMREYDYFEYVDYVKVGLP